MKKEKLFALLYLVVALGLFLYGWVARSAIQGTNLLYMGVWQGKILMNTWGIALLLGSILLGAALVVVGLRLFTLSRRKRRKSSLPPKEESESE